ncbi:MAG: trypsin-like serine protease [Acidobacteriota bacterium]|nr:trypsin-like serine protease [Acidobacteriota bacterium]
MQRFLVIALLTGISHGLAAQEVVKEYPKPDPGRDAIFDRVSVGVHDTIVRSFREDQIGKLVTPEMTTKMLRGDAVTVQDQIKFGLVTINGCSGVLLNNQWAMTSGHCFQVGVARTANVTFIGTTFPSSHVYAFGGEIINAATGAKDLRGPDMALVRTSRPFTINGSTTGFQNEIMRSGGDQLGERPVMIFGQGFNALGGGLFPALGLGVYRFGLLKITRESTSFREPLFEAKPIFNPGPVCAFGDSGGPMFVVDGDRIKLVSIVETGDLTCTPPGPCTAANTTEIRSCKGPKVLDYWQAIGEIISSPLWNAGVPFQLFDVGAAEWLSMNTLIGPGGVDLNVRSWSMSMRSADRMCYNRGFASGHFNGHQLLDRHVYGLACLSSTGDTWRDATSAEISTTPWGVVHIDTVDWAQAGRAATTLCERGGFVGGHFNGHMVPAPGGGGSLFGLICYRQPAKWFDATSADLAGPWAVSDVNSAQWAHASRAANDFCQKRGFGSGFMNGHQLIGNEHRGREKFGVVCH